MSEELKNIIRVALTTAEQDMLNDYITNLQEENKRLKEENKQIFSKVNDDELLISNAMNYAEAQEYKSKCEKAIDVLEELIAEFQLNDYITDFDKKMNKPLNILQGSDKQ